jgi:nucleoside-diphosphate-sugar epimerase
MKRVFVTGGSGFVGRALLAELSRRTIPAAALARSDAAAAQVVALGATPVRGDLADVAALRAGMAGCDVVVHAAARVSDWGSKRDFQRDTIDGTRHVAEAARAAGVRRMVHVSTEAVLVGKGAPKLHGADESWPLPKRPLGLYPWSKGAAEEVVRAAGAAPGAGLETVIVRPRFIWGKGDTVLLPRLVRMVREHKFAWIGGGRFLSSTVHVQNVVHGLLLAAERGTPGETYFVTDGDPVEFRGFIEAMLRRAGADTSKVKDVPFWAARLGAWLGEAAWTIGRLSGEPPVTRTGVRLVGEQVTVSDAKARRELGYAPVVSREAGLAEL